MSQQTINTSTATDTLATGFDKVNSNFTEVYASVIQAGFIIDYVGSSSPSGWLICNGSTIGNATSSAAGRANADTAILFGLLWNNWADAQAAVSGGRGVSAAADFAANKTIAIPDLRGNVSAGIGSGSFATIGVKIGEAMHVLSEAELPDISGHTHEITFDLISASQLSNDISVVTTGGGGGGSGFSNGTTSPLGNGDAHNNIQPTIVLNKIIKL